MSDAVFLRRLLLIVIVGVVLASFWFLRSIWILAFSAIVLATAVRVPATLLQENDVRRGMALLVSSIFTGAFAIFLGLWIIPTILVELGSIAAQLPTMLVSVGDTYEQIRSSSELWAALLPMLDFNELLRAETILGVQGQAAREYLTSLIETSFSIGPILDGLGGFFTLLANLIFVVIISIFFLVEPQNYVRASLFLVPDGYQERVLDIWDELHATLTTWIKVQFLSVTITVILVWLVLGALLGVPHASVVAAFAGIATFIPNIGALLPLIPIVIFTAADEPSLMVWAVPAYLLIQMVESNVITPRIVKSQLEIPSGALLIFQLVATAVFGALGLLLAVPMFAVLITLVREIYSYDILGLRGKQFEVISLGTSGPLTLKQNAPPTPLDDGADVPAPTPVDEDPAAETARKRG